MPTNFPFFSLVLVAGLDYIFLGLDMLAVVVVVAHYCHGLINLRWEGSIITVRVCRAISKQSWFKPALWCFFGAPKISFKIGE